MLTALRLGNFKAFGETQTIPLRPLTLIFGPNSSGKSSIIHGMLFAHEVNRTGNLDVRATSLGDDSVDLGGFRQFVHRRDVSRQVEWAAEFRLAELPGFLATLSSVAGTLSVALTVGVPPPNDGPAPDAARLPTLTSYQIEVDGTPLLQCRSDDAGVIRLEVVQSNHPSFHHLLRSVLGAKLPSYWNRVMGETVPKIQIVQTHIWPTGASIAAPTTDGASKPAEAALQSAIVNGIHQLLAGSAAAISSTLARLSYLGPIRSYPPRHILFGRHHDPNWLAGGGQSYEVVMLRDDLRDAVNGWLGDDDKLSTQYQLVVERYWTTRRNAIEHTELQALSLLDKRRDTMVSHRDVGIGVSQVLPVLVTALGSKNRIVAIEQPEIHLHPALQAELGDLFIESALGERKNMLILETHSEHLILRVMRRMRETFEWHLPGGGIPPLHPSDVAVLYVEPDGPRSVVREMPLNERGELVKAWPGGFFEEGLREVLP